MAWPIAKALTGAWLRRQRRAERGLPLGADPSARQSDARVGADRGFTISSNTVIARLRLRHREWADGVGPCQVVTTSSRLVGDQDGDDESQPGPFTLSPRRR